MSFHPIVQGAATYNQTGDGRYTLATVTVGSPTNEWKISPGKKTQSGTTNCSIARVFEVDAVVNGQTVRTKTTVNLQIQMGAGATLAQVDAAILGISDFLTEATLNRILLGES